MDRYDFEVIQSARDLILTNEHTRIVCHVEKLKLKFDGEWFRPLFQNRIDTFLYGTRMRVRTFFYSKLGYFCRWLSRVIAT